VLIDLFLSIVQRQYSSTDSDIIIIINVLRKRIRPYTIHYRTEQNESSPASEQKTEQREHESTRAREHESTRAHRQRHNIQQNTAGQKCLTLSKKSGSQKSVEQAVVVRERGGTMVEKRKPRKKDSRNESDDRQANILMTTHFHNFSTTILNAEWKQICSTGSKKC
jgi:hypothetical protein